MSENTAEPFLSRWSRRKQEAKATLPVAEPEAPPSEPATEAEPEPPRDLPPIESLGKESDYSAFLKPGVPQDVRAKALERLWASDPNLMAPEIMDLHMGDYSQPGVAEVVKTAWRLGKGVLDAAELAAEGQETAAAGPDESTPPDEEA